MKICRISNVQPESLQNYVQEFNRSKLKTITLLKNLNGASIKESSHVMIIPGGLNKWERLYYASTGNFPESVTDRWFEKGSTGTIIKPGDYEIKIGTHLLNDSDYNLHEVDSTELTHIDLSDSDIQNLDSDSQKNFVDYIIDSITGVL